MTRRLGPYAPLSATYAADDSIIQAGEPAELLYVRALAFCATSSSDGYISDAQLGRLVAVGMRDGKKRAERLVQVGLWNREDGGYTVRGWLKWNASTSELGGSLKKDRERKAALSPAVRALVYERDGNRCRYCGATEELALDHVLPLYLHGGHEPENLQTLCKPCNTRKGRRDATGLSPTQARAAYGITYGNPVTVLQEPPVDSRDVPARVRATPALNSTTQHSTGRDGAAAPNAGNLMAEHIDACAHRPPASVLGQLSKQVATLLNEGIAPDHIRAGLSRFREKDLHPSVLPSLVNSAMNAPIPIVRPSEKRTATAAKFE